MTQRSVVLLGLLLASACSRPEAQQPYDVLITGGSVLNGEGTPAVRADVGIRGGRIATIGDLRTAGWLHGLKLAGVDLDRKVLADIAMHEGGAFSAIIAQARAARPEQASA